MAQEPGKQGIVRPAPAAARYAVRHDVVFTGADGGPLTFDLYSPVPAETLDRFVHHALTANLPISVSNHPLGPHAFDLYDDSAATHGIIEQIVAFLQFQLRVSKQGDPIE